MKIQYAFAPRFDCVMLINGAFNEKPTPVTYPSSSPLYVTLLPLKALLLPYTVKLLGGKPMCNTELARSCEITADRFVIGFAERHNYVYSPKATEEPPLRGLPPRLFALVKAGEFDAARKLMTRELAESVDDAAIAEFFAPYSDIIENPYSDISATHFLIHKDSAKGDGFVFTCDNARISDIEET